MSAYLALRRYGSRALETAAPVALGALLSACVEMLQLFTPHRDCSAIDLMDNTIGSALGVAAGLVFVRVADVPAVFTARFRPRDRCAVALLFCWAASLVFPLFPVMWLTVWRAKISAFVDAPVVNPAGVLLTAASWFAAGSLLAAAGVRSPRKWLTYLLVLVPAQFAIMNRFPAPSDFIGAAAGAVLFYFFGASQGADPIAGAALLFALAVSGLAPFHFEARSQGFSWIPFGGFLNTDWQAGIQILLTKLFGYGASIWLLHRGGLGLLRATALVAVVLAGIEIIQTHTAGHVAEITDPLLALLLGAGLTVLHRFRI